MSLKNRLKTIGINLKNEIRVYQAVIKDRRTPLLGKIFLGMAVGYFFLPFDLIPDFIPIVGHLDDIVIIPILVMIGLKFIPREIVEEYRVKFKNQN